MKISFQKYKPRIIKFRDFRYFESNEEDLLSGMLNFNIEISSKRFTEFRETCSKPLSYHSPSFMKKSLSKEIMKKNTA